MVKHCVEVGSYYNHALYDYDKQEGCETNSDWGFYVPYIWKKYEIYENLKFLIILI